MMLTMRLYLIRLMLIAFIPACFADTFKIVGIPGAPLRYVNASDEVVGMDVDIVKTIMDRLGIKYEINLLNSSTRLKKLWQDPNVDMILTYSHKAERFEHLIYAEQSHITLGWGFFVREEK